MENCDDTLRDIDYGAHPELAIAALIHVMTCFPEMPRPRMAVSIVAHLRLIAEEPRLPEAVRQMAIQACDVWQTRLAGKRASTLLDS